MLMCMRVCMYVYACKGQRATPGVTLARNSLSMFGWSSREPQDLFASAVPVLGSQVHQVCFVFSHTWAVGPELNPHACNVSTLQSPSFIFYIKENPFPALTSLVVRPKKCRHSLWRITDHVVTLPAFTSQANGLPR